MDFSTVLSSIDESALLHLAERMDREGYAVLEHVLSDDELQRARDYVAQQVAVHGHRYFSVHGVEALDDTLLGSFARLPLFHRLLSELYRQGLDHNPDPDERMFPVLRCLAGHNGRKQAHFYHFDATAVTALLPVVIPDDGPYRGDLFIFPNLRRFRRNVLINMLEKSLLQNTFSQRLIAHGIRRGLLRPITVRLVPGHLYLFWGYRSLHGNDECDPRLLRATALYHFGDVHRSSALARRVLGSNKREAKLDHDGLRPSTLRPETPYQAQEPPPLIRPEPLDSEPS
ncbi:hypothetical protein [Stutzerimonas tarimensis]|uniref:Phytanoyl-CoA dioxygenase n=1 Tax=Stutzerimonas tarimensis TaxID=1507735 RepID=A0ABV7T4Y6_9GAMM